jgi:molybdopterin-containing oxidoreductase family iron-sulfur binding subunit
MVVEFPLISPTSSVLPVTASRDVTGRGALTVSGFTIGLDYALFTTAHPVTIPTVRLLDSDGLKPGFAHQPNDDNDREKNMKSHIYSKISGCNNDSCHCEEPPRSTGEEPAPVRDVSRREALSLLLKGAAVGLATSQVACTEQSREEKSLNWDNYFKKNFRLMTKDEKSKTIQRLERLAQIKQGSRPSISAKDATRGVLYGYAFNVSRCKGYMDCVEACVKENNQDRSSKMQYIRIFEMKNGQSTPDQGNGVFQHQVPRPGHFYMGTQCFQCEKPPCVDVCPVGATWKEPDGIVVIDYDWCIGCRYCQSACPYWARRFNWHEPQVPAKELNQKQHYLGNRPRTKGVMEKCTFCIQRTREGQQPACAEACPTGARVFGNLLDPTSEIRYVLKHKKVFRLKEDLGTEPKFWYFMD